MVSEEECMGAIMSIIMYDGVKARVRVNGDVTEAFLCPGGMKQGDFVFSF